MIAWEAAAGPTVHRQGSRFARPAPPACGLDGAPLAWLFAAMRSWLAEALPKRGLLIMPTKTGKAFTKRYFGEKWTKAALEAGITDLHFHDIRGTTVTLLFEAGCTVAEAAAITGHTLRRAQENRTDICRGPPSWRRAR